MEAFKLGMEVDKLDSEAEIMAVLVAGSPFSIFRRPIVLFRASMMKMMATRVAKQSSVNRVMYLTRKLRLNATRMRMKKNDHKPIHKRNSM